MQPRLRSLWFKLACLSCQQRLHICTWMLQFPWMGIFGWALNRGSIHWCSQENVAVCSFWLSCIGFDWTLVSQNRGEVTKARNRCFAFATFSNELKLRVSCKNEQFNPLWKSSIVRTIWLSSEHAAAIFVNKLQAYNLLDSDNFRYNDLGR